MTAWHTNALSDDEFDDYVLDECCARCDGEGFILVCPDDMCRGQGYCIHGDGEAMCPDCNGSG